MRKQITGTGTVSTEKGIWLDLDSLARVEVSSEAAEYPAENALVPGSTEGWRAAHTGEARIVLRFDRPQTVSQTMLQFAEREHERSQEWALTAEFADGTKREVLRQQWNFSPGGSTGQREEYTLNLQAVTALLFWVDPDRGQNRYPATLVAWRVAGLPVHQSNS